MTITAIEAQASTTSHGSAKAAICQNQFVAERKDNTVANQKKMAAELRPQTATEAKASNYYFNDTTNPPICQVRIGEHPSVGDLQKALNEGIIHRYRRMQAQAQKAKAEAVKAAQTAVTCVQAAQAQAQQAAAKVQGRVQAQQAKIRACQAAVNAAEVQIDELITRAKLAGLGDDIEVGQAILAAVDAEVQAVQRSIRGHKLAQANAEKALAEAQKALDAARGEQARLAAIIELARQGREAEALDQVETDEELEVVRLLVEARGLYQRAQTFRDTIPADVQARLEAIETARTALAEAQKALDEGRLEVAQGAFERAQRARGGVQLGTIRRRLAHAWAREARRLACREQTHKAREALEQARQLGGSEEAIREASAKIALHDLRRRVKRVDPSHPQEAARHLEVLQEEAREAGVLPSVLGVINRQRKAVEGYGRQANFLWAQTRRCVRRLAASSEMDVVAYSPFGAGKILAWEALGKRFQAIHAYQWIGGRRDGRWVDGPPAKRIVMDTLPRQAVRVSQPH